MLIDWNQFTPWSASEGGLLIGLAAALLLLFNGRVAGVSGILGELFNLKSNNIGWRLAFVVGLAMSALLWQLFGTFPKIKIDASIEVIEFAGFLVGIGSRFASGCTSGHGVCGLSRLSLRSLVATLVFMAAGLLTVWVVGHVIRAIG